MRSTGIFAGEPRIRVGVLDRYEEVRGRWNGPFLVNGEVTPAGGFAARITGGHLVLADAGGRVLGRGPEIGCAPVGDSTFTLAGVTIGVRFHWERKEDQTFRGDLALLARRDGTIAAVNEIGLEDYLASVISSEMNPEGPMEFLKAHAVTSRSWLAVMMQRTRLDGHHEVPVREKVRGNGEHIRWYDREDHDLFDVCADDHCQRYQGITKVIPERAARAVAETRGVLLAHGGEICDARYHKVCGGLTENFENAWEDRTVAYLTSVADAPHAIEPVRNEAAARHWILSNPDAYCNVTDEDLLRQVLPSFDRETKGFFRWKVEYAREELEGILREKSGMDFGRIQALVPLERGLSGRIVRLRVEGSKRTVTVGKELEIRRWLSRSHLLSSAFIVSV
jgi:peptidoglycan hydrolase-like amidase